MFPVWFHKDSVYSSFQRVPQANQASNSVIIDSFFGAGHYLPSSEVQVETSRSPLAMLNLGPQKSNSPESPYFSQEPWGKPRSKTFNANP